MLLPTTRPADQSFDKMLRATPQLQLQTLFVLDERGRIHSTREPRPAPAPAFVFVRGMAVCVWAVRTDVPERVAGELDRLASQERPRIVGDLDQPLLHARRYEEILGGRIKSGPAFEFPDQLVPTGSGGESIVRDEAALAHHFAGWVSGEIESGRAPVMAIHEGGHPVSVCFCARRSAAARAPAAEAGVETANAFRGRGYAPRVATAWAAMVREQGLVPLYSTDWENHASLAVARKLELIPFAADFSIEV